MLPLTSHVSLCESFFLWPITSRSSSEPTYELSYLGKYLRLWYPNQHSEFCTALTAFAGNITVTFPSSLSSLLLSSVTSTHESNIMRTCWKLVKIHLLSLYFKMTKPICQDPVGCKQQKVLSSYSTPKFTGSHNKSLETAYWCQGLTWWQDCVTVSMLSSLFPRVGDLSHTAWSMVIWSHIQRQTEVLC